MTSEQLKKRFLYTSSVDDSNGWQLVPEEPTPEMLDVAVSYALNVSVHGEGGWSNYMRTIWQRMIAAAPEAGGSQK